MKTVRLVSQEELFTEHPDHDPCPPADRLSRTSWGLPMHTHTHACTHEWQLEPFRCLQRSYSLPWFC